MDLGGLDAGSFSASNLFAGFAFGVFGWYFFKGGRKDGNGAHVIIGLALMIYPYFVTGAWLIWGIGIALMALAFRLR